jgi:16S rRNA (cytosine967-C5)-methyltransferase
VTPEALAAVPAVQLAILSAGARAVRPGGTLVYSVCTISRAESEGVVERFLAGAGGQFTLQAAGEGRDPYLRTMPHRDGTDGFFVARLRRDGAVGATG